MSSTSPHRPLRTDAQRNRAKVLAAAEQIFARSGTSASMREIAHRADVGLATIYRQFPTKEALVEAIIIERLKRLIDRAHSAANSTDPATAFFDFFTFAVVDSAGEKALVDTLTQAGLDPKTKTAKMLRELEEATWVLVQRAQQTEAVRADIGLSEIVTLITTMCLAADRQQWDEKLRTLTLSIVFDGLRSH